MERIKDGDFSELVNFAWNLKNKIEKVDPDDLASQRLLVNEIYGEVCGHARKKTHQYSKPAYRGGGGGVTS